MAKTKLALYDNEQISLFKADERSASALTYIKNQAGDLEISAESGKYITLKSGLWLTSGTSIVSTNGTFSLGKSGDIVNLNVASVTYNIGTLTGSPTFTGNITTQGAGTNTFTGTTNFTGAVNFNGTTAVINASTLQVYDKNIEIGVVTTPTDLTADGGGITLKGTTDKTLIWDDANDNWTSSEHWNLAAGKYFKISNTNLFSYTSPYTYSHQNLRITNTDVTNTTRLLIEGNNGMLFSVVDDMSGSLMSVSDISGIPQFEVFAADEARFGQYALSGYKLGIGKIPTYALDVSGSALIDTTTFFVDSVNHRVGIGTITPQANLDLAIGSFLTTGIATIGDPNNNSVAQLVIKGGAVGAAMISLQRTVGAVSTFSWSLSGGGLAFRDETNGGTPLNLFGGSTQVRAYIGQASAYSYDARTALLSAGTQSVNAGTDKAGVNFNIQGGLGTGAGTLGNIYFDTGVLGATGNTPQTASTKMTILGSGNVGIGTTSPGYKLEVAGTGKFRDTTYFGPESTNYGYASWGTNVFVVRASSGSVLALGSNNVEQMRIDTSGNVGIGTTGPSALIHGLKTTEQLRLGYDVSNYVSFTTGATGDLTIAPSGGDVTVSGSFYATVKHFRIPDQDAPDKTITYTSVEANENLVMLKGKLDSKKNKVDIELPKEWKWLVEESSIVAFFSNEEYDQKLNYVVRSGFIQIRNRVIFNSGIKCSYLIMATRKDINKLQVNS